MKLKVGQIIYILDNDSQQVFPAQVVVENVQKTLKGSNISYKVLLNKLDGKINQELMIDESNFDIVFITSQKVKDYLIQCATKAITEIVKRAEIGSKGFSSEVLIQEEVEEENSEESNDDNTSQKYAKVTLPDGTVARMLLPDD